MHASLTSYIWLKLRLPFFMHTVVTNPELCSMDFIAIGRMKTCIHGILGVTTGSLMRFVMIQTTIGKISF